jgi:hypothetical protein
MSGTKQDKAGVQNLHKPSFNMKSSRANQHTQCSIPLQSTRHSKTPTAAQRVSFVGVEWRGTPARFQHPKAVLSGKAYPLPQAGSWIHDPGSSTEHAGSAQPPAAATKEVGVGGAMSASQAQLHAEEPHSALLKPQPGLQKEAHERPMYHLEL